jgi:hypothetical protein
MATHIADTTSKSPDYGPCECWNCNGMCGGSQHPGWCGPLADYPRGPLCQACRDQADVIGSADWRQGIKVKASPGEDEILLTAGVWTYPPVKVGLSPAEAELLAGKLLGLADAVRRASEVIGK